MPGTPAWLVFSGATRLLVRVCSPEHLPGEFLVTQDAYLSGCGPEHLLGGFLVAQHAYLSGCAALNTCLAGWVRLWP